MSFLRHPAVWGELIAVDTGLCLKKKEHIDSSGTALNGDEQ